MPDARVEMRRPRPSASSSLKTESIKAHPARAGAAKPTGVNRNYRLRVDHDPNPTSLDLAGLPKAGVDAFPTLSSFRVRLTRFFFSTSTFRKHLEQFAAPSLQPTDSARY